MAVRNAEGIQKFLVKSDVDLSDGGTIKITLCEAHTGDKHRAMLLGFWNEFLFKQNQRSISGRLDTWHKTLASSSHGRRKCAFNGSWKYSPEGRSDANDHELQSALTKMKNTKPKVQATSPSVRNTRSNVDKVRDSLWTTKFDADGKVLKRHEHDGDVEHKDIKMRAIHTQTT